MISRIAAVVGATRRARRPRATSAADPRRRRRNDERAPQPGPQPRRLLRWPRCGSPRGRAGWRRAARRERGRRRAARGAGRGPPGRRHLGEAIGVAEHVGVVLRARRLPRPPAARPGRRRPRRRPRAVVRRWRRRGRRPVATRCVGDRRVRRCGSTSPSDEARDRRRCSAKHPLALVELHEVGGHGGLAAGPRAGPSSPGAAANSASVRGGLADHCDVRQRVGRRRDRLGHAVADGSTEIVAVVAARDDEARRDG